MADDLDFLRQIKNSLDLLDNLIDPLLTLSPQEGVLQGRIQAWKTMVREMVVNEYEVRKAMEQAFQQALAQNRADVAKARMDGLPPVWGRVT